MIGRPIIEEQYKNGNDVINYIVYRRTTGDGNDEIMQHKLMGLTETAHITLHPDGTVNFRVKRNKLYLENAIKTNLLGYKPDLSQNAKQFINKVRDKI